MNQIFEKYEKLYRAVYPASVVSMFWKSDGSLSSAAFADKNGISVDRGYYRDNKTVVDDILRRLEGYIVSITAGQCFDVLAEVVYCPSKNNIFHTEIHGDKDNKLLNKRQRRYLAMNARVEYIPQSCR